MLPAFTSAQCECQECQSRRLWSIQMLGFYDGLWRWAYISPFDATNAEQSLCSGGCETHGECDTCCECDKCESLCECEKCGSCDTLVSEGCECCVNCGSSYCGYCDGCDSSECECGCEERSGGYGDSEQWFGSIKVAPWVERGLVVESVHCESSREARDRWSIDESIDLCRAAADKYLLAGIVGKAVNRTESDDDAYSDLLRAEAQSILSDLTTRLDRSFRGYLDMIIGGELRHHRATRTSTLKNSSRKGAWNEWHAIRAAGGTQILRDAVKLFEDFDSCSYGGAAWAQIARTLLDRETGRLSPALFVEKCFMLQHNGGSLFDKMAWQVSNPLGWAYSELNQWVLPAHGAEKNPWTVLLAIASPAVRDLFIEVWRHHNRARVAYGRRAVPMPVSRVPMGKDYYGRPFADWERAHAEGMLGIVHA